MNDQLALELLIYILISTWQLMSHILSLELSTAIKVSYFLPLIYELFQ